MNAWSKGVAAAALTATVGASGVIAPQWASADTVSHLVVDGSGDHGWTFNLDPEQSTPFEMSSTQSRTGVGSIYVPPITNAHNGAADHFTAALEGGFATREFEYFYINFMPIVDAGASMTTGHFYVNLDINLPSSMTDYDCRYTLWTSSVEANTWSNIAFSKASVDFTRPEVLTDRPSDGFTCPVNPFFENMPTGSTVRQVAVHVGDTTNFDTGVGAYVDEGYLALWVGGSWDERYYDFEPPPDSDGDGLSDEVDPDGVAALLPSDTSAYSKTSSRKVFLAELDKVEQLLLSGSTSDALDKLAMLQRKVDGCSATSKPKAQKDDWIIDCTAQIAVQAAIEDLIAAITEGG